MGTAKAYLFQVFAHNPVAATSSAVFRYSMPENVKRRAITAGLIGGVLFFIVAIIVSVCTVKICNRRKRRKQEQGMIYITMSLTRAYKYNTVGDSLGTLSEKYRILLSLVLGRNLKFLPSHGWFDNPAVLQHWCWSSLSPTVYTLYTYRSFGHDIKDKIWNGIS